MLIATMAAPMYIGPKCASSIGGMLGRKAATLSPLRMPAFCSAPASFLERSYNWA